MTFLYFHRIIPDEAQQRSGPDRFNAVNETEFSALLKSLDSRLCGWRETMESPNADDRVALTFDDGYRDFKTVALPHIERAGVHVLLFITARFADKRAIPYEYAISELVRLRPRLVLPNDRLKGLIDLEGESNPYRQLLALMKPMRPTAREQLLEALLEANDLTEAALEVPSMLDLDELKELAAHPLVDVGAHSLAHAYLPSVGPIETWREIRGSKRFLEARLGCRVDCFAYPYGGHTRQARIMARVAGFKYAFTTDQPGRGDMAIARSNGVNWVRDNR